MKINVILVLIVTFGWRIGAQTYTPSVSLRVVDGQIYNVYQSVLWKSMDGDVLKVLTNGVLLSTFTMEPIYQAVATTQYRERMMGFEPARPVLVSKQVKVGDKKVTGKKIILHNYSSDHNLAVGQTINSFLAMQIDPIDFNGDRLELWDYGTTPTQGELRKLKADADERQRAAQNQLDEQRRVATEKKAVAKNAAKAKLLKSFQDMADKGDSYGLLRMGECYRDGDGVEKDLAKAKDYLTKAAAAGSPSAADELKQLPGNHE
jgi:hypothetical protein